jgi:cyclase
MIKTRAIARLDIKNNNVIKGIQLEGLRKVGNPKELIQKYYRAGIEEIFLLDCVASLYGRNNLFQFIKQISEECFVPITLGGGIRSIRDVEDALDSGADKIYVNSQLVRNPSFIEEIIIKYGSQVLVAGIDAKKIGENWKVLIDSGREETGLLVEGWLKVLVDKGVGEIMVTSIDMEGCKKGFDIELVKEVSKLSNVPIIASGGCGSLTHVRKLINNVNVEGISFASVLHYNILEISQIKQILIND